MYILKYSVKRIDRKKVDIRYRYMSSKIGEQLIAKWNKISYNHIYKFESQEIVAITIPVGERVEIDTNNNFYIT